MFVLRVAVILMSGCVSGAAVADDATGGAHPGPGASGAPDSVAASESAIKGSAIDGTRVAGVIRFQAIALPKTSSAIGDRLMILDTQTGDVWQWWDNVAQHVGRTGVTYMGRMKPGSKPGETITYQRFDARKDNR